MSAPGVVAPHSCCPPAAMLFRGLWLFVIFVSVVDGYLAMRYRDLLDSQELNPLGRALLTLNGGQVWCLLAVKFVGTVVAATLAILLFEWRPGWGIVVIAHVALAQFGLLLFLLLA